MAGHSVTIAATNGSSLNAYLAVPEAGSGPGLVLFPAGSGADRDAREAADLYAAEGYVVLRSDVELDAAGAADITAAVAALRGRRECTGKVGALGFGRGGKLAYAAAASAGVDCAIAYYGSGIEDALDLAPGIRCPLAMHFAENDPHLSAETVARIRAAFAASPDIAIYVYAGVSSGFAELANAKYDKPAARLAHSRSIALLRGAIGPHYDLEALWEKHTLYEFGTRDVAATMRTMVAEPYVNHIPVMTGGVGGEELARFYAHHFIPKCPADFKLTPISRTVGADRLVDEMLVSFTHDVEIDWMLPGVPPTGKYVEVPTIAIVNFRGDKLYHEHIYWDQASVLVQIGLLDPAGLPVAGVETAKKLIDETRPSNTLMKRWSESAGTRPGCSGS
jgi:carboxymethylenebutenolidase